MKYNQETMNEYKRKVDYILNQIKIGEEDLEKVSINGNNILAQIAIAKENYNNLCKKNNFTKFLIYLTTLLLLLNVILTLGFGNIELLIISVILAGNAYICFEEEKKMSLIKNGVNKLNKQYETEFLNLFKKKKEIDFNINLSKNIMSTYEDYLKCFFNQEFQTFFKQTILDGDIKLLYNLDYSFCENNDLLNRYMKLLDVYKELYPDFVIENTIPDSIYNFDNYEKPLQRVKK